VIVALFFITVTRRTLWLIELSFSWPAWTNNNRREQHEDKTDGSRFLYLNAYDGSGFRL
jgi:hypothetical protein